MKRDYPERPMVGVGAIILRNQPFPQVALVKRGNPPLKGEWTIPGGVLELGEELEAGARREAREETGLEVRMTGAVEVFDRIVRDEKGEVEFHYVLIDYVCEVESGELCAGGDAVDARWFSHEELGKAGVSEFTAGVVGKHLASGP
ncbi:MAG: NUDIX hydrolase [Acidobacteriaceae bacterium]